MKYDGYYLVEVLIPETYSLTMKMGSTNYYLCTKKGDTFYDVGTNDSYCINSGYGKPEVLGCMPLSELLGLKRRSAKKSSESSEAYKLVKEHKKVLKKINNKPIIK